MIDLAAGRLARAEGEGTAVTLADLPDGVRVTRVLVGSDVTDFGQVRVPVSAEGRSPSYALGLSTPAGDRWLVVVGLTGQVIPAADASAADADLEPTRAP